jgi:hypothetical protein
MILVGLERGVLPQLTSNNSRRPPPTKTLPLPCSDSLRHSTFQNETGILAAQSTDLSQGAGCFARSSRGSPCCGSAFWSCVVSGAPLIHASPKRKTPRPLKLRMPNTCPLCRWPQPTPSGGPVRKPGVLPWRERKTSRGKRKTICTAGDAGPHPVCDYLGNTDSTSHALGGDRKRGADSIQWLCCPAGGQRAFRQIVEVV